MRTMFLGGVLALAIAACAQTRANDQSAGAGAGGGGSANLGGGTSTAGTLPHLMPDPSGPDESDLTRYCGGDFYCETADCIGLVECEGTGASQIASCRCIARLPGAGGEGGVAGAGGNDALPSAPEPYPGPGCPVRPEPIVCGVPCIKSGGCSYGDVSLCCGRSGEDCGASWQRCTCTQTDGQTECVVDD